MPNKIMSRVYQRAPSLRDRRYHIYAMYARPDQDRVLDILSFLRENGYRIFDPLQHAIPGTGRLQSLKKNGMDSSRFFLVFLSKHFHKDLLIKFQVEQVTIETGIKPGRHRIITVMLKSCKIPRFLIGETCVYAWQYDQDKVKVQQRIITTLQARQTLIQRKHFHHSLNGRAKTRRARSYVSELSTIFNCKKVTSVLNNCVIACPNEGCTFRCGGGDFSKFHKHIKNCKFLVLTCQDPICNQAIQEKQLDHHLGNCSFRKMRCKMDGCDKLFLQHEIKDHEKDCRFQTRWCPFKKRGCQSQFLANELPYHLESCKFKPIECPYCQQKFTQEDLISHICEEEEEPCAICKHLVRRKHSQRHLEECSSLVFCENGGCEVRVQRGKLRQHQLDCPFTRYPCPNDGCNTQYRKTLLATHVKHCVFQRTRCDECGTQMVQRDIPVHRRECDKLTECDRCGVFLSSSSKETHDRWLCTVVMFTCVCDVCLSTMTYDEFQNHRSCHFPVESQGKQDTPSQRKLSDESTDLENSHRLPKEDASFLHSVIYQSSSKTLFPYMSDSTKSSCGVTYSHSINSDWSFSNIHITPKQRQLMRDLDCTIEKHKKDFTRIISLPKQIY